MSGPVCLILAMALDAALGEPRWLWSRLPHPAELMGRAVGWLDQRLNRGPGLRLRGLLALAILMAGAGGLGWLLAQLGPVVEILCAAILLAQRSLVEHVGAVADGLRRGLPGGRQAVAMIVSRDTADMDAPRIARSAIESAAENLSDGVIAPAFWFLLGGLPGILIYKAVNTADSMIGYRTPRHEAFGWASARMDDLLNLVPARLTALLIGLSHGRLPWAAIRRDARRHRSPNAGWPEAAMARVLDVALAGPRSYDGQMRELAWVNGRARREIDAAEIDAAVSCLWRSWLAGLLLVLAMALL
ncbi:adenosylcobinamide-phosphate synthase CbiB [Marinibacterium sp. SX1]|uniref:adenosylcobinamide-phosphate synthase CbiB n=1 Tax=Marinibacterium sp. SX1 TaxID=3388424 RepID=UPI003D17B276